MARGKSKTAAAVVKKAAAVSKSRKTVKPVVKAPRKKRVGNARGLILKALNGGAKTRPVLLKSTGVSYNALVMHLSKLRDEGIVETDSSNRLISLVGGKTSTAESTPKSKPAVKATPAPTTTLPQLARDTALVAGYSPRVLNEALDALASRFKPITALDEKLLVLDQLSVQIGGPIGHVLASIKADLLGFPGN